MNRRHFFTVSGGLGLLALAGCSDGSELWSNAPGPKVVVSFAPLYSIAKYVLGSRGELKTILSSSGPHGTDIKISEANTLRKADLFFINGLGLENNSANKLILAASNKSLKLVDLGAEIPAKELLEGDCGHDHSNGEAHDHDHEDNTDPHVWLGLEHAMLFASVMANRLSQVDPTEAAMYQQNADAFRAEAEALKAEGVAMFKPKVERKFLPLHGSMQYFAKTFGLTMLDPIQTIPGQEPTSKKLEEIIAACTTQKCRVIAVEPQFSGQSSAKRISDELSRRGMADVVLVELDPLETARLEDLNAAWYLTRMRHNVAELNKVLR